MSETPLNTEKVCRKLRRLPDLTLMRWGTIYGRLDLDMGDAYCTIREILENLECNPTEQVEYSYGDFSGILSRKILKHAMRNCLTISGDCAVCEETKYLDICDECQKLCCKVCLNIYRFCSDYPEDFYKFPLAQDCRRWFWRICDNCTGSCASCGSEDLGYCRWYCGRFSNSGYTQPAHFFCNVCCILKGCPACDKLIS